MHPAELFQFERAAREYARWAAVAAADRSAAPGWWWGPAFALRDAGDPLPRHLCALLQLADGTPCAAGARLLLGAFAGQTELPWPAAFMKRAD